MANPLHEVTRAETQCRFDRERVDAFVKIVECMAAGDTSVRLPISAEQRFMGAVL